MPGRSGGARPATAAGPVPGVAGSGTGSPNRVAARGGDRGGRVVLFRFDARASCRTVAGRRRVFVLSGYLITAILLRNRDADYYRNFYARRRCGSGRLLPHAVRPGGPSGRPTGPLEPATDLYAERPAIWSRRPTGSSRRSRTRWTLAIEEQFYMTGPWWSGSRAWASLARPGDGGRVDRPCGSGGWTDRPAGGPAPPDGFAWGGLLAATGPGASRPRGWRRLCRRSCGLRRAVARGPRPGGPPSTARAGRRGQRRVRRRGDACERAHRPRSAIELATISYGMSLPPAGHGLPGRRAGE